MRVPQFWDKRQSILATLLRPFGWLYAWAVARRFKKIKPYQADIPVICVGNLSAGGMGKTPVCQALGDLLLDADQSFFYLCNGYKGKQKGVVVDLATHSALDVGDEALILAQKAPTVVDDHRARGAQIAEHYGAKCLVMDDGFQNPSLVKTLSFIVVDGKRGFGNEQVIPAGPLREPISKGLARADAIILVGEDTWGVRFYLQRHQIDLPVLTGYFDVDPTCFESFVGKEAMAFAGIGYPQKFFDLLIQKEINLVKKQAFPDHYFYTRFDVDDLLKQAAGRPLLTTEKDWVKIPPEQRHHITAILGQFHFDDPQSIRAILRDILT